MVSLEVNLVYNKWIHIILISLRCYAQHTDGSVLEDLMKMPQILTFSNRIWLQTFRYSTDYTSVRILLREWFNTGHAMEKYTSVTYVD